MRLADAAEALGVRVKIHIKIDTGMGRIGFLHRGGDQSELLLAAEVCQRHGLAPEGIYTHFAVADESNDGDAYTADQLSCFNDAVDRLKKMGISFEIKHAANSAAIFDHPESHFDMVRAGVMLYGLKPSGKMRYLPELQPVMTLKSVVSHVKHIRKGETVSYGRVFTADRDTEVATVPIGYADGLWRVNNGAGDCYMLVGGKYAKVIGRICMDQLMLDVSGLNVSVGDEVTVFGNDRICSADAIADRNKTINYEVVCDVGMRVPRAFVENGEISSWLDNIYDGDLNRSCL